MSSHRPTIIATAFGVLAVLMTIAMLYDTPFSMVVRNSAIQLARHAISIFDIETITSAVQVVRGWGIAGALLFIGFYALGSLIAFPSSLMTFVAVLAFGYGAILVTGVGAFLGLSAAFFVGRRFFRQHVGWFCSRYPVTRGIERAIEKNGFWLVFLMRQSPVVPFAAQNYMFGMLRTQPRDYLLASGLGIIPGTIAKIYVFQSASRAVSGGWSDLQIVFAAIGAGATLMVMLVIGRYVRHELDAQTS